MLIVRDLSYKFSSGIALFEGISFSINEDEKVAIIGKNGIGKSVLLQLIIGNLEAYNGKITKSNIIFSYFPQKFNELEFNTVSDVFGFEKQVKSLIKIEKGEADIEDYENLDGKWDCIDIIKEKMKLFNLNFELLRDFNTLSGGEKVKLILSSIINKNSNFLILDEPTNNMDYESKKIFYDFIKKWEGSILLVSHDRELLKLVNKIIEIRKVGLSDIKLFSYGGNFDYWLEQKQIEKAAMEKNYNDSLKQIKHSQIELQNEREMKDRKRKEGERNYGEKARASQNAAGLIIMAAESKRGQLARQCNNRVEKANNKVDEMKSKLEIKQEVYFKFSPTKFSNKILIEIEDLNFSYDRRKIFTNFSLTVNGGERISIEGKNGSGKTTLLKIINKQIPNYTGLVRINSGNISYLDQNCDFLDNHKTILENIRNINPNIAEKDCRDNLAKFLFRTDAVYKKVIDLSGGEKLRVALACILLKEPELLLLDEPTNNMDLDTIEVLEEILNSYNGAIMVVSHDNVFKENIKIAKTINIELKG